MYIYSPNRAEIIVTLEGGGLVVLAFNTGKTKSNRFTSFLCMYPNVGIEKPTSISLYNVYTSSNSIVKSYGYSDLLMINPKTLPFAVVCIE